MILKLANKHSVNLNKKPETLYFSKIQRSLKYSETTITNRNYMLQVPSSTFSSRAAMRLGPETFVFSSPRTEQIYDFTFISSVWGGVTLGPSPGGSNSLKVFETDI